MHIPQLIENQRAFFKTGKTKDIRYRKAALVRFRESVKKNEQAIHDALYTDFKKPDFESLASETGVILRELDLAIKKIELWSQPKRTKPFLLDFPSSAKIYSEPYGTTLIIGAWNYPFQLTLAPLIGAIAAGNTAVLKPSELTPATSSLMQKIVSEIFAPGHVTLVQGGIPESTELLAQRWDYIFFTGSVFVGKIVAKAAAQYLTPVTLELGGKNPCVIDETANIPLAAKRIVWGKFLNAGQTCIAPDYILVHRSKKEALLKALENAITKAYSSNAETSGDFAHIINEKNFDRLGKMLEGETIVTGGTTNRQSLYISPTVLDAPSIDSTVMADEIFGPILPVLSYDTKADIEAVIERYEKSLSGYVFSRKRSFAHWFIDRFSFGGGAINDTVSYFVNDHLPFGGVGTSGTGSYHGEHSYKEFSHQKSITRKSTLIDIPVRYAPYKGKKTLLKTFYKWL